MLNKCLYKRFRHKKGIMYAYCTKTRQEVPLNCEIECIDKEYKKNNPIKKVSKKKISVSQETYNKVYSRDRGCCRLKDDKCEFRLEAHHIYYRSERKDLIDDPNNLIMLCTYHHRLVHNNKKKWQPILLEKLNKSE